MSAWERAPCFDADADGIALVTARIQRVDVDGVRRSHLQAAEEHGAAGGATPGAAADARLVGQSGGRIPYGVDPSRARAVAQVGRRRNRFRSGRRCGSPSRGRSRSRRSFHRDVDAVEIYPRRRSKCRVAGSGAATVDVS